jgi:hypothetical protein
MLWKQAHQAAEPRRGDTRWTVQPLLLTLLVLTWCAGDSQPERFETARAFTVAYAPKRRRPGQTCQGFHNALARLPMPVLRAFAAGLRQRLLAVLGPFLATDGYVVLGCDGSRLRCPRVAELEQRLRTGTQADAPPQVWVTAVVLLRLGVLWSWWLGAGDASERLHLLHLVATLPAQALLVTDAGYQGYEVASQLLRQQVAFLTRISSQTQLYAADAAVPAGAWQDGLVWWWTTEAQKQGLPPLRLRLLRLRCAARKVDVWLLTNVLEAERLPLATAAKFYKMRWENEGFFRTYKRTLAKVKLQSRTVRLVHREAYGSLLAVQLLLAQGAWAVGLLGRQPQAVSSPRRVLQEIRRERSGRPGAWQRHSYVERLAQAQRERRPRSSSKVKRSWPGRADHQPPKPPKIREMPAKLKGLLQQPLKAA